MEISTISQSKKLLELTKEKLTGISSCRADKRDNWDDYAALKNEEAFLEEKIKAMSKRAESMWRRSNVGDWFSGRTFDNWDKSRFPNQYKRCVEFAENMTVGDGKSIILAGMVGTGKTHLATAIANYAVYEHGISAYFNTVGGLLREIQRNFKGGNSLDAEKIAKECGLLVMDDLGKEDLSKWGEQILFDILDTRYRNGLAIIVTTNKDLAELNDRFDEAVMSRLVSTSETLEFKGEDYRIASKPVYNAILTNIGGG